MEEQPATQKGPPVLPLALVILLVVGGLGYLLLSANTTEPKGTGSQKENAPKMIEKEAAPSTDSLTVEPQKAGSIVTIAEVSLLKGGYVLVHKVGQDGTIGPILGNSDYLSPGVHKNVTVKLYDSSFEPGDRGVAGLRNDDGDKKYGQADAELQVKNDAGRLIQQEFSLQ